MDKCLICQKPVPDYEPQYCCRGSSECACQGEPMNPCVCSIECEAAVYDYIGMEFDDRRKAAGIEKWTNPEEASDESK